MDRRIGFKKKGQEAELQRRRHRRRRRNSTLHRGSNRTHATTHQPSTVGSEHALELRVKPRLPHPLPPEPGSCAGVQLCQQAVSLVAG
jgi:hypothetical protein